MYIYYPYPATDGRHKYYIITDTGKKLYFGASGYSDYTIHKDEERKQRYINRHKKNEDWTKSGINTAGWFSRWLLWEEPNIRDAYKKIKDKLLKWGIISKSQYNQYVF
jgi:hypothetical protein